MSYLRESTEASACNFATLNSYSSGLYDPTDPAKVAMRASRLRAAASDDKPPYDVLSGKHGCMGYSTQASGYGKCGDDGNPMVNLNKQVVKSYRR